jgi:hypothetical protein
MQAQLAIVIEHWHARQFSAENTAAISKSILPRRKS